MPLAARKAGFLGLALLGIMPVAASADDLAKVMGADGANACFTRLYTDDHLAGHPDQNVRSMSAGIGSAAGGAFELSLDLEFREGSSTSGRVLADCRRGNNGYVLRCLARCDGGRIEIKVRDAETIRLEIPDAVQQERGGSCDPSSTTGEGALWSDDKVFRLSRADLTRCQLPASGKGRTETAWPDKAPPVTGPVDETRQ